MKDRLKHLSAVENMQTISDPDFGRWADTRLDRWLVDWALRKGWEKTAKKIASEKGIEVRRPIYGEAYFVSIDVVIEQRLVDIDLYMEIRRIEDALSRHSCVEALTWCNENKAALRKIKVSVIRN
jgi:macrophage erythroblast attacher